MTFAFIADNADEQPVTWMCEALEVSASGYYSWVTRADSPTQQWRDELVGAIQVIHAEMKQRYGSPRMHAEWNAREYECSENTVARLMKPHEVRAKAPKRFVRTTDSNHRLPVAQNILARDFEPEGPNQVWCADITYIPTHEGWLYLAVVEDLFNRMIVGWSMDDSMKSRLVVDALEIAIARRLKGSLSSDLIAHSDRGSPYASEHDQRIVSEEGITCSMSEVGQCWDNAPMESYFGRLKCEVSPSEMFTTRDQARAELLEYLEVFDNRVRLHSSLGFLSPDEFDGRTNRNAAHCVSIFLGEDHTRLNAMMTGVTRLCDPHQHLRFQPPTERARASTKRARSGRAAPRVVLLHIHRIRPSRLNTALMRRGPFVTICLLAFAGRSPAAEPVTFEQHVRPILKAYCLDCHGAGEKMPGGLDLRLKRLAVAGGKNGAAVVAKEPSKSLLIERMKSGEMPPVGKKVPADQIAIIEKWIVGGALTLRDEPASLPPGLGITVEERAYWFYQPLKRPAVPVVANPNAPIRNPIDAFVLAKLREKGLGFNREADRATLIRRATFDLTGLPPTAKEIDAFLEDKTPDAYENLIERLLASPTYGERWGRHWLDAAGYADSDGDGNTDTVRPVAWRYRDYVVRALNADKPLDRFVTEQLAGDELVPRPWVNLKPEQIDLLAATGFLRTAPDGTTTGATDAEQVMTDTLKIITSSLIGSSVACAQCHDHRYDPIPQRDYYQLRAVFEPALDPGKWRKPGERLVSLYSDADRAKSATVAAEAAKMQADFNQKQAAAVRVAFEKELEKVPADEREKMKAAFDTAEAKRNPEQKKLVASNPKLNVTPGVLYQYNAKAADELKALQAKIQAKQAERPVEQFVAVTAEVPGREPATRLFHRGDARQPKGPDLVASDLTIAAPADKRFEIVPPAANSSTTGRRLAWAKHLTDGTHPLFGRVMANRVWLHHFGRGIVDTPGEFGKLGQLPTHPELLDWLAVELPKQGWSLKSFHKLIMTSTTYRQSSKRDTAKDTADRANALYSRFPVRRLEAEAVRDRMLVAAGRLDGTPYGPAVTVVEDAAGQVGTPDDKPRRSVYLQVRRSKPVAFLSAFDAPGADLNCERRNTTTTAPQSLMLLNSDFVRKQAGYVAARVRAEAKAGATAQRLAETAWRLAYLRPPTADELRLATTFLATQMSALKGKAKDAELAALTNLCQQLMASNEFLYVD